MPARPSPAAAARVDGGHLAGAAVPLLLFGIVTALIAAGRILPAEDAAMLFAYSVNLADTGVISYYGGGPRAEGATDFLYMVALAALHRVGLSPAIGAGVLTAIGAAITAAATYEIARPTLAEARPWQRAAIGASIAATLIGTSFLAPAMHGFSVYVFLAPIGLLVLFTLRGNGTGVFLAALCTCLVRPDGVVFAAPLVLCHLWQERCSPRTWLGFTLLLLLPGIAYFLWRWSYFDAFLPLPFHVKTGGARDLFGLFYRDSARANLYALSNTVTLIFLAALATAPWRRIPGFIRDNFWLLLALAAGLVFYAAVKQEQNEGFRFQAPLVLLVLILFLRLPTGIATRLPLLVVAALAAAPVAYDAFRDANAEARDDNITPLAAELASLPRGTMLVTEAGRLPYLSGWVAIDSWGLNTAELARRVILPEDIPIYAPDLIVAHSYAPVARIEARAFPRETGRSWENQVGNILLGAAEGYDLYYVPFYRPGSPTFARQPRHDLYLVRRESPLAPALRALIAAHGGVTGNELRARFRFSVG